MNIILFGATGMIGQAALTECLEDPRVEQVVAVLRRPTGRTHAKLRELLHADFADYTAIERDLSGFDACLFCLGISAAGLSEGEYRRITHDYTLAAARALLRRNPDIRFVYVSGQGTDSTAQGRVMWARVKGETENDLLALPFNGAYMFRPGYIQPVKGAVSSTRLYRLAYATIGALYPLWKALFPNSVTTSEILGRAMIQATVDAGPSRVVDIKEINALGAR